MKSSEYLGRYRTELLYIKTLEDMIDELNDDIDLHNKVDEDKLHVSGTGFDDAVARRTRLQEELISKAVDAELTRVEIIKAIDGMSNPVYKRMLYLRHIEMKMWEAIADQINYSRTQTFRLRKKAYEDFEKVLKSGTVWD